MNLRVGCFADASFWIALSSRRDQLHRSAIAWRQHLVRSDGLLITTEPVLWEWLNGLADTTTRGVAAEGYRRCHRDNRDEVVSLSGNLIEAAISLCEARPDKNWSLNGLLFLQRDARTQPDTRTDGRPPFPASRIFRRITRRSAGVPQRLISHVPVNSGVNRNDLEAWERYDEHNS